MTFGLYLLLTIFMMLLVMVWLRSLVVRRLKPDRLLGELRGEVQGLVAELNQTGDRHVSLLEDRIDTLHGLIRDADREIDALRLLLENVSVSPAAQTSPAVEPTREGVAAPPVESLPEEAEPLEPEPPPPREEAIADTVRRLSDQGFSPERISHSTGMAIGEVELILSLRKGQRWR